MSYQVLARKWRPKIFSEVIGQPHIMTALKNAIASSKVAHAYLFTGTRGVGKTTVARIFAKALRCENLDQNSNPCLKCDNCIDVEKSSSLDYIEIDGASNTGVDNIRELIDNVQYLPSSGSKKVYVIDEVHMLSVNAFNALLKTLEEPPAHVVFIFATTDPQKLLGTVLSRCQRMDFKHVDIETLKLHLENIAYKENIHFESKKVTLDLAKFAEGSVRDSLSLMDQVLSLSLDNKITENDLLLSLGLAKTSSLKNILEALFLNNKEALIKNFNMAINQNVDVKKLSKQILDSIFDIIENVDINGEVINEIIDEEVITNLSISEIVWIYEVLLKDFKWAFENTNPDKMILFTLVKVALRSEVLGIRGTKLSLKKKTERGKELVREEVKLTDTKNWDGLLAYTFKNYLAIGSNLEHGNIIDEIKTDEESINVEIGFSKDSKVFYDYLNEQEIKNKVKDIIAEYFGTNKKVVLKLINVKDNDDFKSKAQINEINDTELKNKKIQEIKDNKYIREAQEIFGVEIESITIKE